MKEKNNYWQIIRGLCILAVILIHSPNAASYSIDSIPFNMWLVIRQIINFPVAIFLFLSGYLVNSKKYIGNNKYRFFVF